MARRSPIVILFLLMVALLCSGFFTSSAQAAGFSQCNGGMPKANAGDCPILDMNGDEPDMIDFKLPKPIGTVQLPSKVYLFSGPLCIVDYSVRTTMESLYAVFSDAFLNPFRAILMIYVCVYAISFMYGLVNPKDFGLRLFKIAMVWVLVSDNCTFYNYIYGGFISASNDLVRIMSEVNSGTPPGSVGEAQKQLYTSLDDMFQNVVGIDGLMSLGVLSLTFIESGSKGFGAEMLLWLGVGSMALAMLRALVTLGIAMAATAFFLLFTPMFLSFFLFQTTKRMFDSWLSMLISYTLQPFIIFAFLVMMRIVIDSAAPSGDGINGILDTAKDMITNQTVNVNMLDSIKSGEMYIPDPQAIQNLGANLTPPITINPCANMDADPPEEGCDNQSDINEKFSQHFMPKLLFWFLVNMVMAGFIREVPAFAQRLAGFISAPIIGETTDSIIHRHGSHGVNLPGISRSLGGGATSMLGEALRNNRMMRDFAVSGIGLSLAAATSRRDGPSAANQAADGQVNRDGARLTRTGTLAELLGSKTVGRDGARVEGIDPTETAPREGPNIIGISKETTERRGDILDTLRKAQEQKMATANENMKKGAELLGAKAPELPEKPTVARNVLLRDIELVTQKEKTSIYMVNGQKVEVNKAEEERFLMQKIAEINKDMNKARILGERGGVELSHSQQQKELLQKRLNELMNERQKTEAAKIILAEKRALEALQKAPPSPEVANILQQLPGAVQQKNAFTGAAKIGESISQLKELDGTRYAGAIRELEKLQKTLQVNAAQRGDTMVTAAKNDAVKTQEIPQPDAPQPDMPSFATKEEEINYLRHEAVSALHNAGLADEAIKAAEFEHPQAVDAMANALAAKNEEEYRESIQALERLERELEENRLTAAKMAATEAERLLAEKLADPNLNLENAVDNLLKKKEEETPQQSSTPPAEGVPHQKGYVEVKRKKEVWNDKTQEWEVKEESVWLPPDVS